MKRSIMEMVAAARSVVPAISPEEAKALLGREDVVFVDVRDTDEVEKSGKVAGAVNISRGMLEFRADPDTPYHDKGFARDRTIILYCASGGR
ncbi:MAG TPA: rhodanese-like domain-containing protein, partial [Paracoccaceae bacterium]|nr:rhodanese-like domain-containing protein [Paracoccaceae bacterium]